MSDSGLTNKMQINLKGVIKWEGLIKIKLILKLNQLKLNLTWINNVKHIKYEPCSALAQQTLYHVQNVIIAKKLFYIPCQIICNFYKERPSFRDTICTSSYKNHSDQTQNHPGTLHNTH